MIAVGLTAGGGVVLASVYLWYQRQSVGNTWDQPPSSDIDVGNPAPDPYPPGLQWEELANSLRTNNPELEAQLDASVTLEVATETAAKQCLTMMADAGRDQNDCETLPIFMSGNDVSSATAHDIRSIRSHFAWAGLTYEQKGPNTQWYHGYPESDPGLQDFCVDPGSGRSCHEFPFWKTLQGGPNHVPLPRLKLINSGDNSLQGSF